MSWPIGQSDSGIPETMTQLLSSPSLHFQGFGREREVRKCHDQSSQAWYNPQHQGRAAPSLNFQGLAAQPLVPFNTWENRPLGLEWLKNAIAELEHIDDEVVEEALPGIRSDTKDKARKIIFALMHQPIAPTIYPTMDGEIALYFKSPMTTSSVLLLVGNDGQAACFSYIDGKNRRARYEDATELPDEFVRAQLRSLKEPAFSKDT